MVHPPPNKLNIYLRYLVSPSMSVADIIDPLKYILSQVSSYTRSQVCAVSKLWNLLSCQVSTHEGIQCNSIDDVKLAARIGDYHNIAKYNPSHLIIWQDILIGGYKELYMPLFEKIKEYSQYKQKWSEVLMYACHSSNSEMINYCIFDLGFVNYRDGFIGACMAGNLNNMVCMYERSNHCLSAYAKRIGYKHLCKTNNKDAVSWYRHVFLYHVCDGYDPMGICDALTAQNVDMAIHISKLYYCSRIDIDWFVRVCLRAGCRCNCIGFVKYTFDKYGYQHIYDLLNDLPTGTNKKTEDFLLDLKNKI